MRNDKVHILSTHQFFKKIQKPIRLCFKPFRGIVRDVIKRVKLKAQTTGPRARTSTNAMVFNIFGNGRLWEDRRNGFCAINTASTVRGPPTDKSLRKWRFQRVFQNSTHCRTRRQPDRPCADEGVSCAQARCVLCVYVRAANSVAFLESPREPVTPSSCQCVCS